MAEQPKYLQVAETLRREIADGLFQDGEKLMTEETLRDRFGVSRQTVRQAIALLEDDGLVDRLRGSGTYVRHGVRKHQGAIRVGVVTTYISDYIFPEIVRGIETVLSESGIVMTLSATYNNPVAERKILERTIEGQVDGLIIEGVRTAYEMANADCFRRLAERNIPVLFMNGAYEKMQNIPFLVMDDYEGGRQAAEVLLERGYRRPAGMFKTDDLQGRERARGLLEGARGQGVEIPEKRMLWFGTEHRLDVMATTEGQAFADMLASGEADCVVCYNDTFASAVLQEMEARKIPVPEKLGIISFDNSSYARLARPRLTSFQHPQETFGEAVARKMLRMIDGRKEESEKMPWHLVEGESLPRVNRK